MAKILKFGEQAKEALLKGINVVNDAVSSTLGPRGNNVAIDRKWGAPQVVHDGVTVAKEVDLVDPFENMGVQLAKEAASKTNDAAGDGTTTATILVQSIVKEGLRNITAGSNAMMIRRGIEKAVEIVVERLKKMAKEIKTPEEIEQVAIISAQDEKIGQMIAKTINKIGKDGVVTVEESGTTQISVDFKEGMEFDRGFISPYFMTNPVVQEATINNPYILVTDKKISSMIEFLPFLQNFMQADKPQGTDLVIIAEEISGEPLATLIVNRIKGNMRCLAVRAPGFGDRRKDVLEDIAILTGATFISQETGMKIENVTIENLGRAKRVTSVKDSTLIVDGLGESEKIIERIESIKQQLDKDISDFDKEKLEERLAKLTTGIAIINVGANSEVEMREKKERCVDAIAATKAALAEGIIPGGATSLIRASKVLKDSLPETMTEEEKVGVNIVYKACQEPFRILMKNSGYDEGKMLNQVENTKEPKGVDVIDGQIKDLLKSGIIDPVKVTRTALQNAASTAVMIMTTNTLITEEPKKEALPNPVDVNPRAY